MARRAATAPSPSNGTPSGPQFPLRWRNRRGLRASGAPADALFTATGPRGSGPIGHIEGAEEARRTALFDEAVARAFDSLDLVAEIRVVALVDDHLAPILD